MSYNVGPIYEKTTRSSANSAVARPREWLALLWPIPGKRPDGKERFREACGRCSREIRDLARRVLRGRAARRRAARAREKADGRVSSLGRRRRQKRQKTQRGGGRTPPRDGKTENADTWLILPVVICLSQRLSHACLSTSSNTW